jgi:5-methyltetrahydrofolate--homocysteine methyltransferase
MTFDATPRGPITVMGVDVAKAAAGLEAAGAHVVGSNCGQGIAAMVEVARAFAAHAAGPIAIQANAGLPVPGARGLSWPETPEDFARHAPALLAAGVRLVGGCCGTTPDHVRALRRAVDAWRAAR